MAGWRYSMIRVLIVDDDPAVLDVAKIFLGRCGDIEVEAVGSAVEAVERLKDDRYDVIVSDYVMPEMDGISFLKWVRSLEPEIPFILFTGKGREEVVIEALNNGADYYLQKDANPRILYAELTHQIRQASERLRTKRAVIESEERYRALFENMNEGFVLYEVVRDPQGRAIDYVVRDANPQIEQIAGMKPEEAMGRRASEIFRSDGPPFLDIYSEVDETGTPTKFEGYFPETGRHFSISAFSIGRGRFATIFTEITEQNRMNEELCRAHHQLQEIIDFLPDATFVIDERKTVIAWNRAIEEMTGVAKDEIVGKGNYAYGEPFFGFERPVLIDSIFAEDSEIDSDYDLLSRRGKAIFAEVYAPHLYGGRGAYIWAIASPLYDDDGKIAGAIESIRDVTSRKRAEMALQETSEYLESLLHYANAPIAVWGPNMKFIRINRAFERLTGYAAEEMIGEDAKILLPEEGREEALAKMAYALEGEGWESVEIPIQCRGGGVRTVLWNSANIRSEKDGTVVATIIQGQDITERKLAEERLIQAHKQLLEIIDFLPDPTFVIDGERRVIAWNRAIEEMTGVPKDEIVGEGDYAYGEVFYGTRRPILIDMIFSKDEDLESIYHYVKREGDTLFAEAYVTPPRTGRGSYVWGTASPLFDRDGNISGAIESIRDVTEIRRYQEALQEANRKLKLLSSITRHDILNQITGLSGYAHLLREGLPRDPAVERYIDRIAELAETIKRQLAFTRDYQEMGVKAPEWQRVSEVVRRAAAASPAEISGGQVRLEVETETVEVFADPMLEKVFCNLLENAVRHGGGVTGVRVSFFERGKGGAGAEGGEGDGEGEGVIVVEDDGLGVPAGMKARIFDQAFGRHTGYGLFLSREILGITRMTISETGVEGRGARFEISVPRENYRRR